MTENDKFPLGLVVPVPAITSGKCFNAMNSKSSWICLGRQMSEAEQKHMEKSWTGTASMFKRVPAAGAVALLASASAKQYCSTAEVVTACRLPTFRTLSVSVSLCLSVCTREKKFLHFNNTLITLCSHFWLKVCVHATKKGCFLGKFFHRHPEDCFPSGVKRLRQK